MSGRATIGNICVFHNMKKKFLLIGIVMFLLGGFLFYRGIYIQTGDASENKTISISSGLTVRQIASLLKEEGIVSSDDLLVKYLVWKDLDTNIQHGDIMFEIPHTIARVATALTSRTSVAEKEITLLPGWNLREIAVYLEKEGITSQEAFFEAVGTPLVMKSGSYDLQSVDAFASVPPGVNLEGYLRPDTFRIFASASIGDIVDKLVQARADQFTDQMLADIEKQGKTVHEIITMASIIEREVRTPEDRRLVSDLFWRRKSIGMALQADSTVHYVVGTDNSVFTSVHDRAVDSLWNTYKYPELPPGPISNPSLDAIMSAIYPTANDAWYFLTTLDTGEVKYAQTLDEHIDNVYTYLRQ